MKLFLTALLLTLLTSVSLAQPADVEQEVTELSAKKWQWMADKQVDSLAVLFDDGARFVHMSGSWGKARELDIIESGSIHYAKADVHDVVVEVSGNTVMLWNRITLTAEVRGNTVSNEFTVTEVYQEREEGWTMLGMSFSSVRDTHEIEH